MPHWGRWAKQWEMGSVLQENLLWTWRAGPVPSRTCWGPKPGTADWGFSWYGSPKPACPGVCIPSRITCLFPPEWRNGFRVGLSLFDWFHVWLSCLYQWGCVWHHLSIILEQNHPGVASQTSSYFSVILRQSSGTAEGLALLYLISSFFLFF